MDLTNNERIWQIYEHYGGAHQIEKAIEELDELKQALTNEDSTLHDVAEELADVLIMAEQIRIIYEISAEELNDIIKYKITRTHMRIAEDG